MKNLLAIVRQAREEKVVAPRRIAEKLVATAWLKEVAEARLQAKTWAAATKRPRSKMSAKREKMPRNVIARRSGESGEAMEQARCSTFVARWPQASCLWEGLE
jgi:hypothetical protein